MTGRIAKLLLLSALISLTLIVGGCGNAPAYAPVKPLAPAVQPASVTPAAKGTEQAIAAMAAPIQSLKTETPALTGQNVDTVRPRLVAFIDTLSTLWATATASAQKASADAQANDAQSAAVMAAVKARDVQIADLAKQAAALSAQVQADQSEFQRKIYTYAVLLTVIVAAVVGLLVYMTQLKAAICTAIGGAGAILFLLAIGWVDRFKVEICLSIVTVGIAYLVGETLYRKFHDQLRWGQAIVAALTESPVT